jgi:aminopeptidase N
METEFFQTPKMSTYILAMVVGDLRCYEQKLDNFISKNVSVQVCARKNALNQIEVLNKYNGYLFDKMSVLSFFEEYFNVSFPLKKLGKLFNYSYIFNYYICLNILNE